MVLAIAVMEPKNTETTTEVKNGVNQLTAL